MDEKMNSGGHSCADQKEEAVSAFDCELETKSVSQEAIRCAMTLLEKHLFKQMKTESNFAYSSRLEILGSLSLCFAALQQDISYSADQDLKTCLLDMASTCVFAVAGSIPTTQPNE